MQRVAVESLKREQSEQVLLLFCFLILITTKMRQLVLMKIEIFHDCIFNCNM